MLSMLDIKVFSKLLQKLIVKFDESLNEDPTQIQIKNHKKEGTDCPPQLIDEFNKKL